MEPVIFILNGPNLNLLGVREPAIYGTSTLADVETRTRMFAQNIGLQVDFRQTNHEGVLVEWIHEARKAAQGIIMNAAALSHTSVAVYDALRGADVPTVEVHLSNIHARESFRHHSFVSAAAIGVIVGLGVEGYEFALQALARRVCRIDPTKPIAV